MNPTIKHLADLTEEQNKIIDELAENIETLEKITQILELEREIIKIEAKL